MEAYEQKAKERAQAEEGDSAGKKSRVEDEQAPKRFKTEEAEEEDKEEFKPAEPGRAGPQGSERAFLQPRTRKVDINSRIGATEIVSAEAAAKTSLNDETGSAKVRTKNGQEIVFFCCYF